MERIKLAPVKGVLPPVVTPFKDEELDLEAFESNLKALNQTGLSGYVVLGSTGESVYLNEHEKELVLAAAREGRRAGQAAGNGHRPGVHPGGHPPHPFGGQATAPTLCWW